jgi:hypothetical protein
MTSELILTIAIIVLFVACHWYMQVDRRLWKRLLEINKEISEMNQVLISENKILIDDLKLLIDINRRKK